MNYTYPLGHNKRIFCTLEIGAILFAGGWNVLYLKDLSWTHKLFRIYVNVCFADDTTAWLIRNTVVEPKSLISETLRELSRWFTLNGLIINENKTTTMSFHLSKTAWEQIGTETYTFLEILIYYELNLNTILDKKLRRVFFAAYVLLLKLWKAVYFGFVESIFIYGTILWLESFNSHKLFD